MLINVGLRKRFNSECSNWTHESTAVEAQCRRRRDSELRKIKVKLDKEEESVAAAVHEAVIEEVLKLYPYVLVFFFCLSCVHSLDSFLKESFANTKKNFTSSGKS